MARLFLDFFQSRDHLLIANASLIPKGDATLLFINSGMAPLKNYFLGREKPPHPNLCNIQGCIRTKDIDDVGDRHHLTYFEMLGSWSIGHYWKSRAIALAFELLTERFGFPVDRLYATVFAGDEALGVPPDEESLRVWRSMGLPADHIVPLGKDNFWGPAGDFGPCGPCTEVFYDTGDAFGARYEPGGVFDTEKRYIEIWNAGVFMEYDKQPGGLVPLAIRSVDTGSGLERMVMTLNGYDSVYDTDVLRPVVSVVREQLVRPDDPTANLIADHVRAAAFILAEGQIPSNIGAGYIPRRLIRRCVATASQHGVKGFSFPRILEAVFASLRSWNGHIREKSEAIMQAFQEEQRDFERVLGRGLERLAAISGGESPRLAGADAFKLFATYGLPIDTMREYLRDRGGAVDEVAFAQAYEVPPGGVATAGRGHRHRRRGPRHPSPHRVHWLCGHGGERSRAPAAWGWSFPGYCRGGNVGADRDGSHALLCRERRSDRRSRRTHRGRGPG